MAAALIIALLALYRVFFTGLLGSAGSGTYASSYRGGAIAGTALLIVAAVRIFLAGRLFLGGLRHVRGEELAPPSRRPAAVAMAIVLVLLVAGAALSRASGAGAGSQAAWSTGQAINEHAGFIDGCRASSGGRVNCDCVFTRLAGTPPYDTPAGFVTLSDAFDRYRRTGDRSAIPPAYIQAVAGCRTAA